MTGRILVRRVYEAPSAADGLRVLADRLWPRGLSRAAARIDLWAKAVAPTTELRRWFGHDPARWDAFRERYLAELAANPALPDLRRQLAGHDRVTLLFAARDVTRSHAPLLRAVLEGD